MKAVGRIIDSENASGIVSIQQGTTFTNTTLQSTLLACEVSWRDNAFIASGESRFLFFIFFHPFLPCELKKEREASKESCRVKKSNVVACIVVIPVRIGQGSSLIFFLSPLFLCSAVWDSLRKGVSIAFFFLVSGFFSFRHFHQRLLLRCDMAFPRFFPGGLL